MKLNKKELISSTAIGKSTVVSRFFARVLWTCPCPLLLPDFDLARLCLRFRLLPALLVSPPLWFGKRVGLLLRLLEGDGVFGVDETGGVEIGAVGDGVVGAVSIALGVVGLGIDVVDIVGVVELVSEESTVLENSLISLGAKPVSSDVLRVSVDLSAFEDLSLLVYSVPPSPLLKLNAPLPVLSSSSSSGFMLLDSTRLSPDISPVGVSIHQYGMERPENDHLPSPPDDMV